jgi:hypothetical protein
MHVRIATPMYGGNCKGIYLDSLFNLVFELIRNGHEVSMSKVYNESLITRARNNLVHEFIKSDADALLFIDADEGFNHEDVTRMVNAGKDLIGGIYPMKNINWDQVRQAVLAGKENLSDYSGFFAVNVLSEKTEINFNEPFQVTQIGTGMMFITRKVFEDMKPTCKSYALNQSDGSFDMNDLVTEYFKTEVTDGNILLSEDYYFCEKWRELGGEVWAAPWVNIIHAGDYGFSGSFFHDIVLRNEQLKGDQPTQLSQRDSLLLLDTTDDHSESEQNLD